MDKRTTLLVIVLCLLMSAGCETMKGANQDITTGIEKTPHVLVKAWHQVEKLDQWIKDNWW